MAFLAPLNLRHTLVLPDPASGNAGLLLEGAISDLNRILMLILGQDAEAERLVPLADQLCGKTQTVSGGNARQVVWVRHPAAVQGILDRLEVPKDARVAVLNFHERIQKVLTDADQADATDLEFAFLAGGA